MDAPFLLTRAQVRKVDRIAIEEFGIAGVVLMENAGRGVVEVLLEVDASLAGAARGSGSRVVILCGKGNNAGDGFVIARHLGVRDVASRVILLCSPSELTGDALVNYEILLRSGADVVDVSAIAPAELCGTLSRLASAAHWLIDAMLGTGAIGPPREPFRTTIEWMNSQNARRLAVDLPSGLDCDTGDAPGGIAVRADVTCTFVAAKPGLVVTAAARWVGDLRVVSIGVPPRIVAQVLTSG